MASKFYPAVVKEEPIEFHLVEDVPGEQMKIRF